MSSKKYAVFPGYIHSQSDYDMHYISASDLISLYGVNPEECIIYITGSQTRVSGKGLIHLRPKFDGDYSLTPNQRLRLVTLSARESESYADSILEVYGSLPKGKFYEDLTVVVGGRI